MVKVTQADRDAAAEYGRAVGILTRTECRAMRSGENDDCTLIQAFARHRISHQPQPSAEQATVDRIVAWLSDQGEQMAKVGDAYGGAALVHASWAIQRGDWK